MLPILLLLLEEIEVVVNVRLVIVISLPAKVDDVMHMEPNARNASNLDAQSMQKWLDYAVDMEDGSNASSKTVRRLHNKVDYAVNIDQHGSNARSKAVLRLPSKVDDVTHMEPNAHASNANTPDAQRM